MQSYNENMAAFLQYCNTSRRYRPLRTNRTLFEEPPTTPYTTLSFNYEIPASNNNNNNRLTFQNINDATTIYSLTVDQLQEMQETVCPISHQEFCEGDIVCRINSCNHEFRYADVMRWFDVNSTCPVCRGSIIHPQATDQPENVQQQQQQQPHHGTATDVEQPGYASEPVQPNPVTSPTRNSEQAQTNSQHTDALANILRAFLPSDTDLLYSQDFDISFSSIFFPNRRM
jgi:hypothetical protein